MPSEEPLPYYSCSPKAGFLRGPRETSSLARGQLAVLAIKPLPLRSHPHSSQHIPKLGGGRLPNITACLCVCVCRGTCGGKDNVSLCHIPSSRRICLGRRQGFKSCGTLVGSRGKQRLEALFSAAGRCKVSLVGSGWDSREVSSTCLFFSESCLCPFNNPFGPCPLKKKPLYPNVPCTFLNYQLGSLVSLIYPLNSHQVSI